MIEFSFRDRDRDQDRDRVTDRDRDRDENREKDKGRRDHEEKKTIKKIIHCLCGSKAIPLDRIWFYLISIPAKINK